MVLDPTGQSEELWNRYAHIYFTPGIPGSPPDFILNSPDSLTIVVDPCDRRLAQLNVKMIVANAPLNDSCVTLVKVVSSADTEFHFYSRN